MSERVFVSIELAHSHLRINIEKGLVMRNPPDEVQSDSKGEMEIIHPAPIITIKQFMKQPFEPIDFGDSEEE